MGIAYRQIKEIDYDSIQKAERQQFESDLVFLGFIVLRNMLKDETTETIETLLAANIRPIMVTGDNIVTALSVAKECSMIGQGDKVIVIEASKEKNQSKPVVSWRYADSQQTATEYYIKNNLNSSHWVPVETRLHVALTGSSFKLIRDFCPDFLEKIAVRGTVFARMAPEQKQQLVELLQSIGYYVGMCGDGANDCGALKAAHAGVSLSEAEASIASPFTSKITNISCVPTLIKEGMKLLK